MLWVWPRPAAVALIGPLAWELPYAALVTLKEREREREREIPAPSFECGHRYIFIISLSLSFFFHILVPAS